MKEILVHSLRSKGKYFTFFVNETGQSGLRRESDKTECYFNISLFQLGGLMLASLTDQLQQTNFLRLEDKQAYIKKELKETTVPAIFSVRALTQKNNEFPLKTVSSILSIQSFSENFSVNIPLYAIDVMELTGKIANCGLAPKNYIIGGGLLIKNDNNRLFFKVGGSEPVEFDENMRLSFISVLKRWLSGEYLTQMSRQNDKEETEKRFMRPNFNRNGFRFSGRERPIVSCNNTRIPFLSYMEVAELFLLLENCKASEEIAMNNKSTEEKE